VTAMLHDVMEYYGLHRDFRQAGFFETEQYHQLFTELKTAIRQGQLVLNHSEFDG
jgi:hypothetical protein